MDFFSSRAASSGAGGTDSQKNLSIQQKNSGKLAGNQQNDRKNQKDGGLLGFFRAPGFCRASDDQVTAMREMAGDTRSRITAQEDPGRSRVPDRKNNSVSRTSSMAPKESRETSMLRKNEARTFAWKDLFHRQRTVKQRFRVCFSFSPTKELAAMTEAAIMGTIRKKTGRM